MRFLIALTLALSALSAQAVAVEEPLQYDFKADAKQRLIIRLYVRTRTCLGEAGRAILRQGVREPAVVQHFMVSMCGDAFYSQLRRDGMSEEQARLTLVELTKTALYHDVLRQPIPE